MTNVKSFLESVMAGGDEWNFQDAKFDYHFHSTKRGTATLYYGEKRRKEVFPTLREDTKFIFELYAVKTDGKIYLVKERFLDDPSFDDFLLKDTITTLDSFTGTLQEHLNTSVENLIKECSKNANPLTLSEETVSMIKQSVRISILNDEMPDKTVRFAQSFITDEDVTRVLIGEETVEECIERKLEKVKPSIQKDATSFACEKYYLEHPEGLVSDWERKIAKALESKHIFTFEVDGQRKDILFENPYPVWGSLIHGMDIVHPLLSGFDRHAKASDIVAIKTPEGELLSKK